MIVVFGKGKVGNGIKGLLDVLKKDCVLMDDSDLDDSILDSAELILVSPGVKQSHFVYQKYKNKIKSELNFLGKLLLELNIKNITWIGITATNGKSTTTWLTYNLLKKYFPEKMVWITGNFGEPISQTLTNIIQSNQLDNEHILVVECSSFMLYELQDFVFDYGIWLNIAKDHLDWHKDFEEYLDSKSNLIKNSKFGFVSEDLSYDFGKELITFGQGFDLSKTKFLGNHNKQNFAAVIAFFQKFASIEGFNLDMNLVGDILSKVEPLDHRLKLLKKIGNIDIYDDGISTSSQSLNSALMAFDKKVVLIAGGYDKGDDYAWLQNAFSKKLAFASLLGQTSTKISFVCEQVGIDYKINLSLHDAVLLAYQKAIDLGLDVILFSPGSASFDMFKNVYDRVEQFEKEVSSLVSVEVQND